MTRQKTFLSIVLTSLTLFPFVATGGTASEAAGGATALNSAPQEIEISCGQARVSMQCERASAEGCMQSRLMWQFGRKRPKRVQPPVEVEADRFPKGLACVQGQHNKQLVAVQYSSFPQDCKFCEFLFLYDESGHLLTRSRPLILGVGAEQRPNLVQFSRTLKRLNAPALEWTYLR